MNRRERLLAALKGEEVDRIPWSPCMDAYFTSSLPEQGYHMDLLETLRFLRADIMERHVPIIKEKVENVTVREIKRGNTITYEYATPVGTLTEEKKVSGKTTYRSKPLLRNREDLKIYLYIVEHTSYSPCFEEFLARDKFIGDDGMATPSGNLTPIQSLLQHLMGVEGVVYALADYPEEMDQLLAAMHERNKVAYELMAESPSPVVFTYEDTSTTVMSPNMYVSYSAPQLNEYADILHKAGKIFITHMCGKLKGFIDLIGNGNMDGIDSLCPPTTGDLWAHEAREAWGEDKVIIGGIEPPALTRITAKQTVEYVVCVLNCMAPGKAFILSSGDAVSYGTPIENLLAITEVVERAGTYPLQGDIDADVLWEQIEGVLPR